MADSTPLDRSDLERAETQVILTTNAVANELRGGPARAVVTLDSALDRDLGFDSLARVELIARLEQEFGVDLNERHAFAVDTPRDLLGLLLKAGSGQALRLTAVSAQHDDSDENAISPPHHATTLIEMLEWFAAEHAERTHIQLYDDYSDGAEITYGDLYRHALEVAAVLQSLGLEPDETVALMLPTSRDYFVAFCAVLLAGGIPVPIYPPVRRQQLEDHLKRQSRILDTCKAAILITNDEAIAAARLLTVSLDSLRHVFDLSNDLVTAASEELNRTFEPASRTPDDIAFLQYTSGSTGDPKGVILTHANLLANVRADGQALGVDSNDVFVSWLPLYHDMGLIGAWFGSMYHAVRLVVMPPLAFLARPERWLWAIHRYGGTVSAAPNFAYELCLKRISDEAIEGIDLSRWRIAANGAEAIRARTLELFSARFAPYGFARKAMFPVYGLAECSVGLAFSLLDREPVIDRIDRRQLTEHGRAVPVDVPAADVSTLELVACGRPLPGHEIRVVDENNREVPERHEGSLQFRGPSATQGYYNRPEATAALIRNGWLETGDRGYIAGGDVYITGRSKDMIIRAGRNIYPAELEDEIGDLDGIRKGHVAVFGTADHEHGTERLVVLAETRKRAEDTREALSQSINEIATALVTAPADEIVFAPPNTVLRTSSGKIRRSACKALFEQGRIGKAEKKVWLQITRLLIAGFGPQCRRLTRSLATRAYAVWTWLSFAALAIVIWLLAWLPLPRRALWRSARLLARTAAAAAGISIRVRDADRLPTAGQTAVLVANHQSYLDGIVMLATLACPVRFLVKGELKQSRLLATPLSRIGALFVERFDARAGIESIAAAESALKQGEAIMVFPEGTFKRMPGLLPFHMGAFSVAVSCNTPVIPIAIRGTRQILRADSWFPRRGHIEIHVDTPVEPESGEAWSVALALRDASRGFILEHNGEPDLSHESNKVERRIA